MAVLVIDNDGEGREVCRRALELIGIQMRAIEEFESWKEVLGEPIQLVLVGVAFHSLNAWEMALLLRKDTKLANTPVVILAEHIAPADHKRAHDIGVQGLFLKPIPPLHLAVELKRILAMPRRTLSAGSTQ